MVKLRQCCSHCIHSQKLRVGNVWAQLAHFLLFVQSRFPAVGMVVVGICTSINLIQTACQRRVQRPIYKVIVKLIKFMLTITSLPTHPFILDSSEPWRIESLLTGMSMSLPYLLTRWPLILLDTVSLWGFCFRDIC